jgi:nitrite reductase (NADH) large subunit
MVVISAGVRPNMELTEPLGLDRDKGIQVNERMETSRAGVYAAGDVAEFKGIPYGIWPAAAEQGKIAGENMAGGDMIYKGTTMSNTLKVAGVDLASAGNIDADNELEARVYTDEGIYKKIVLDAGRIVGCIMLGDTKGFTKITRAIAEKMDVSQIDDPLLLKGFH